jgi:hypothetical protein
MYSKDNRINIQLDIRGILTRRSYSFLIITRIQYQQIFFYIKLSSEYNIRTFLRITKNNICI